MVTWRTNQVLRGGEGQEEVPRGGARRGPKGRKERDKKRSQGEGTRRGLKGGRGRDKKRSQGEEGTMGGERQVHLTRLQNTNRSHGHHEFLGLFTDHATSLIIMWSAGKLCNPWYYIETTHTLTDAPSSHPHQHTPYTYIISIHTV